MMRRARRCACLALIALAPACQLQPPTLTAAWVPAVPEPRGVRRDIIWGDVPETRVTLTRGHGRDRERLTARLQAIHDGRRFALTVRWPDASETFVRRAWVWDDRRADYRLEQYPVDRLVVLWPLEPDAPGFRLLDGRPGRYDVWEWIAGWSDVSGHAEDRTLELRPHPPGVTPIDIEGPLYPALDGGGMVEFIWREDPGTPGTRPAEKPLLHEKGRMPGATAELEWAAGSRADVRCRGLFLPEQHEHQRIWLHDSPPEGEQPSGREGHWRVELQRLLHTGADHDHRIATDRTHRFAISVYDNYAPRDPYASGPIRLRLEPAR